MRRSDAHGDLGNLAKHQCNNGFNERLLLIFYEHLLLLFFFNSDEGDR